MELEKNVKIKDRQNNKPWSYSKGERSDYF